MSKLTAKIVLQYLDIDELPCIQLQQFFNKNNNLPISMLKSIKRQLNGIITISPEITELVTILKQCYFPFRQKGGHIYDSATNKIILTLPK